MAEYRLAEENAEAIILKTFYFAAAFDLFRNFNSKPAKSHRAIVVTSRFLKLEFRKANLTFL